MGAGPYTDIVVALPIAFIMVALRCPMGAVVRDFIAIEAMGFERVFCACIDTSLHGHRGGRP